MDGDVEKRVYTASTVRVCTSIWRIPAAGSVAAAAVLTTFSLGRVSARMERVRYLCGTNGMRRPAADNDDGDDVLDLNSGLLGPLPDSHGHDNVAARARPRGWRGRLDIRLLHRGNGEHRTTVTGEGGCGGTKNWGLLAVRLRF